MLRSYLQPDAWREGELLLSPEESHHLLQVRRARPGDPVVVFDGAGREAEGVLEAAAGPCARVRVLRTRHEPRPALRLILAQALLKSARMDWLLEKATELGAAVIVPVEAQRCAVALREAAREKRLERWRKIAVAAVKQCGAAWLPDIAPPTRLETWLDELPQADLLLLGDPGAASRPLRDVLAEREAARITSVAVLIGPEGDFTEPEKEAARRAGAVSVTFGPRTLRAETAALYALSVLHHRLAPREGRGPEIASGGPRL